MDIIRVSKRPLTPLPHPARWPPEVGPQKGVLQEGLASLEEDGRAACRGRSPPPCSSTHSRLASPWTLSSWGMASSAQGQEVHGSPVITGKAPCPLRPDGPQSPWGSLVQKHRARQRACQKRQHPSQADCPASPPDRYRTVTGSLGLKSSSHTWSRPHPKSGKGASWAASAPRNIQSRLPPSPSQTIQPDPDATPAGHLGANGNLV